MLTLNPFNGPFSLSLLLYPGYSASGSVFAKEISSITQQPDATSKSHKPASEMIHL